MAVHDELESVLAGGRWRELTPYLLPGTGNGSGQEAQAWYRSRRAHWAERYRWASWPREESVDGPGALRILALAYATPAQAAKELGRLTSGWRATASDELAVAAAVARGREFCQPFLEAASGLTFSKEDEWHVGWVARVGLPLVAAGVADVPDGPAFGRGWATHFAERSLQGSLVDDLRRSPALQEGLARALAAPDAMGRFETYRRPDQQLESALAQLVTEGLLDRERVLDGVLEALTRQDTAHSQRALARVLGALDLGREDAATRVPLLLHLLSTARGPVTAVLLPPVLDVAGDADLPGVAATVFARPEKAQRDRLLRALVAKDAPWGRAARVQALASAADLPDQALAGRAARALTDLGADAPVAHEVPLDGLWADPPAVADAGPATVVAPEEASMTAALSRMTVGMDASDGAMFWDAAVRWSRADLHGARSWARGFDDRVGDVPQPSGLRALQAEQWDAATAASHQALCASVEKVHTGIRDGHDMSAWNVLSRSTSQVLHDVLVSETKVRLGQIPSLLSTPTRSNGVLDLAALVERLRGYAAGSHLAGPADLFVALTRLERVDPAHPVGLDGVSVGLWSTDQRGLQRLFRHRSRLDAGRIVRDWVAGGGMPTLRVSHRRGAVDIAPPSLPVPASTFGGIPPSLVGGHEDGVHDEYYDWSVGVETDAGMLPGWADLLAARLQRSFDQKGRFPPLLLPAMAASPSPGRAVVHVVAATLSHADEDRRLLAVDAALTLMGRGLWDPADYTTCCEHLLADGELRLARLAHSWEQLILAGALKPLWPTARTVLDRACALDRKPPGLAELLAMLRRYVAVVPDLVVPGSVTALASSKGASKAKAEAAAFVAVVP